MEKKICSYETLFAVSGNLAEDASKALVEKFVNLVKDNATDVDVNEWGKRRFAYPINYVTEGYYVLVSYKANPDFPQELERQFGITEGLLLVAVPYENVPRVVILFSAGRRYDGLQFAKIVYFVQYPQLAT